jgi:hypothetical protein
LLALGQTYRETRNVTESWWENLSERAQLEDKKKGGGNTEVRGLLEKQVVRTEDK